MRKLLLTSTMALLGLTSTAEAHFVLMAPAPTNPADASGGKGAPPCGPDTSTTSTPIAAQGGHAIMLKLLETVPHDGFYRVALSIKSRSEIPLDNVVYDSKNNVLKPVANQPGSADHADFEDPPVFPVLADHLFDHVGAGMQTFMSPNAGVPPIVLPNVTCDRCTLQVIEFMHPHGYNPGGGFFYHHCADLKITADPALPAFVMPTGTDAGAPDAVVGKDASPEVSGAGGTMTTGTGGSGGSTGGVGGSSGGTGASGGSSGAAGAATGGSGGTTGSAGTSGTGGTTGAAGATSGTNGGAGSRSNGGGGGCSLASSSTADLLRPSALILLAAFLSRRRKSFRA